MFGKHMKYSGTRKAKGQGVIEYSGALVVAAIIVAAGIIIVPPNFAALFDTVYTTMADFLAGEMPT